MNESAERGRKAGSFSPTPGCAATSPLVRRFAFPGGRGKKNDLHALGGFWQFGDGLFFRPVASPHCMEAVRMLTDLPDLGQTCSVLFCRAALEHRIARMARPRWRTQTRSLRASIGSVD